MKKIFSDSKPRALIALGVTTILISLSILAVQGEGLEYNKLIPALFLSILAGVTITEKPVVDKKFTTVMMIAIPFFALCGMEFFTHVPGDLTLPIGFLNYLFYLLLYALCTFMFGNSRWGTIAATCVPMLFGTANYFVMAFRSSPIVPWDFLSLGTAVTITDNYTFEITYRLVWVIIGFVFLMILGEKTRIRFKKSKVRLAVLAVSVVLMGGYVAGVQTNAVKFVFGLDDILFTPNVLYRNNGFAVAFLANLQYLNVEKPNGYSAEEAQELADEIESGEQEANGGEPGKNMPNIIVIMNEAFADLSVYGPVNTSEDYMPFIHSLQKDTVKGDLYVSVKGGNTANTEFEFLTGNTMAFLPAGSVPYQQFIKGEMPSLASHLGSMGYHTAALHPFYPSGWNRDQVYEYLGFDSQYFMEDFENASMLRGFVDDASSFDKLIELYESKEAGKPLFAFEVTMQNHGGYSKEYPDLHPEIFLNDLEEDEKNIQTEAVEKYLTLMKKTDEAFEDFVNYFAEQEEETIVVMFGDHQPSDYISNPLLRLQGIDTSAREASLDEFSKGYIVPYVIWANFDIEEEETEATSVNYLSGLLMEKAGLPMSGYQSFLAGLEKNYPVVTANFYQDIKDKAFYKVENAEEEETDIFTLHNYSILQYNDICDPKHRVDRFFGD